MKWGLQDSGMYTWICVFSHLSFPSPNIWAYGWYQLMLTEPENLQDIKFLNILAK